MLGVGLMWLEFSELVSVTNNIKLWQSCRRNWFCIIEFLALVG